MLREHVIKTDLCVVGGGLAGMCAAIRGAREGLQVVLMQERPVLGGNASSEIRMWICGANGRDNRETGILEEICLENLYRNPTKNYYLWDTVLYEFVKRERNLTLLLNCTCMKADVEEGAFAHGRGKRIRSVTGYQMTTQEFFRVEAKMYGDCSGDSILAPLCGADFMLGREGKEDFGEDTDREASDQKVMGMSCLIQAREQERAVPFIPPDWSRTLTENERLLRRPDLHDTLENFWYLELGGEQDTIADTEEVRDKLIPLAMGMWDYVKHGYGENTDRWDLEFVGFLPGKRESRRMVGEYVLTQKDLSRGREFEDAAAYGGWKMDDHCPGGFFYDGPPNRLFQVQEPYQIPYRCLYSKNVDNLFFAGRNISATHLALSSTRVMGTCAILGEAVGAAAFLAVTREASPHDVYLRHLGELQQILMNGDCFLPGRKRKVSPVCDGAAGIPECLRQGMDREHECYGDHKGKLVKNREELAYEFPGGEYVGTVHIVFDSDLNRETLAGDKTERTHSMRANVRLDSPLVSLPKTLCREFAVSSEGRLLCHVTDNRKRCIRIPVERRVRDVRLTVLSNWGETGKTRVLAFDVEESGLLEDGQLKNPLTRKNDS